MRVLRRRGLATFAFLVLTAEVAGRSLTGHVDRALHVAPLARTSASYYPFLLVGVKAVGALVIAALLARGLRAWAAAEAGDRLLAAVGHAHERRSPKLRPGLSFRVWLYAFASTSVVYLLHTDVEGIADGRWPLFAPWLHSSALPVFAVLAVVVALLYGAVARWLADYERYASALASAVRLSGSTPLRHAHPSSYASPPRRLFGLAFESRPPPLAA